MNKSVVSIVGGGLSGLCTALALQKNGIFPAIYEKDSLLFSPDTAVILGANALKALDYLGVGRQVRNCGRSTDRCTIKSDYGTVLTILNYYPQEVPNYTIIHRSNLMNILSQALSPNTVSYDKKLVNFHKEDDTIELHFADGTISMTDFLIGSDGLFSAIRRKLVPDQPVKFSGYACFRGILKNCPDVFQNAYKETWGPRGRFGIAPMPDNQLYWYTLKNCRETDEEIAKWTSIDLLFNFFYYHSPIQQILEKVKNEEIFHQIVYDIDPLDRYIFGENIILVGDSAHAATPNLGQGASQAMEDALFLAIYLEKSPDIKSALLLYEQERLQRLRKVAIDSRNIGKIAQMEVPLFCSIRNKVMQMTPSSYHQNRLKNLFEIKALNEIKQLY